MKYKKTTKCKPTAVFDVCDTMYYSNTTHDFIHFVFKEKSISVKKLVYNLLNSKLLPLKYVLITVSVFTNLDLLKKLNVYLLKGMSLRSISQLAERFVDEFLQDKKIVQIHNLIKTYKCAGLCIILCSSSIEPVVKAIADKTGNKDYIGTELEFEKGIFTGKILKDTTSKKLEFLEKVNLSGKIEYAISDNVSDLELLTAANNGIAVVHNKKKYDFWRKHKVKIIDLNL